MVWLELCIENRLNDLIGLTMTTQRFWKVLLLMHCSSHLHRRRQCHGEQGRPLQPRHGVCAVPSHWWVVGHGLKKSFEHFAGQ